MSNSSGLSAVALKINEALLQSLSIFNFSEYSTSSQGINQFKYHSLRSIFI